MYYYLEHNKTLKHIKLVHKIAKKKETDAPSFKICCCCFMLLMMYIPLLDICGKNQRNCGENKPKMLRLSICYNYKISNLFVMTESNGEYPH